MSTTSERQAASQPDGYLAGGRLADDADLAVGLQQREKAGANQRSDVRAERATTATRFGAPLTRVEVRTRDARGDEHVIAVGFEPGTGNKVRITTSSCPTATRTSCASTWPSSPT